MKKIEISIIIPIYNVEKYLKKCLESVYKLNLSNKEIILVNDGSTDTSLKIAEEYEEKYFQSTILISQENKGLSGARNTGINNSKGKYILFIDSDDFIDPVETEKFLNFGISLKQDILIGNYSEYFNGRIDKEKLFSKKLLKEENKDGIFFLEEGMKEKCFTVVVWRNLYKKDFLLKNNLSFKEKLLHEDNLFTLQAFLLAKKVMYVDNLFYFYRKDNPTSIMKKMSEKNFRHMLYIIQELIKFQKRLKQDNPFYNRILIGIYWEVLNKGKIKNEEIFTKLRKLKLNFKEKIKIIFIFIYQLKCRDCKENT